MSWTAPKLSCTLIHFTYPKYWEENAELLTSADELLSRLQALYLAFQSRHGEGICFRIRDEQGNSLQVCMCEKGWVLVALPTVGRSSISVGKDGAKGYQAFLTPEWTEIEKRHLVPKDFAWQAVRDWVSTGQLSNSISWTV
jgi:hypothetical protein